MRDRIADPLGLDLWIGVPEARRGTVARMEAPLPDAVEPQEADASAPAGRLTGGYGDARARTLTEALDQVLRG